MDEEIERDESMPQMNVNLAKFEVISAFPYLKLPQSYARVRKGKNG